MKKHALILLFSLIAVSLSAQEINCPKEGSTTKTKYKILNTKKNRTETPAPSDVDSTISLASFFQKGSDETRFDETRAATIEGYIYDIKIGGIESCNCREKDQNLRDVHVEIVLKKTHKTKKQRFIAEITPRFRDATFAKLGIEKTNKELKKLLKGKKVKITGWLLFDEEHKLESYSIDPKDTKGRKNWRATCWEIHPITNIEVADE